MNIQTRDILCPEYNNPYITEFDKTVFTLYFSINIIVLLKQLKIFILLFLLCFFPSKILFSQSSQFEFRHIDANDGLTAPSIHSIVKDKQGFIWLATSIGLYRYDGYKFKEYRSNPANLNSLSSNLLTGQLFLDQSGDLWIGTKDRGLNCFNIATETFIRYQHDPNNSKSLSSNNVHKVIQDCNEIIWIATLGGGVNKFNNENRTFISFYPESTDQSEANIIQSLIEFDEENLLVGTRKSLYLFNKSTNLFSSFSAAFTNTVFNNEEVISDIIIDDSILWIGTENGLVKFDIRNNEAKRFNAFESDNSSLSCSLIRQIVNSPDNLSLWISTAWGLNRFNKKTSITERFLYNSDDPRSIGYNMLWGLFIDKTNLLWIGTDNAGVNVLNLNKSPFHHIKMGANPNDEQFSAIVFAEDKDDHFWVGTFGGGLWQFDGNNNLLMQYQHKAGNPNTLVNNTVFSLCEDSDGYLWIGTSNSGVNKLRNDDLTRLIIDNGSSVNNPTSIIEIAIDQQNVVWLGTLNGLYFYNKSNEKGIENIGVEPLNHALIRSICIDGKNNIWIGTHGEGLFKHKLNDDYRPEFKRYRHNSDDTMSINSDIVMSVYEDNEGDIWIASNHGLNKYLPARDGFESFDKESGLKTDYLYYIQGEKNGTLWITSSLGLMRYDPGLRINRRTRIFEFNKDVPFEDIYAYSFYLKKNGEICIGGKSGSDNGYYKFHPDSITDNTLIPKIAITSFKVKNEDYKWDSIISVKNLLELDFDQNFITFEFTALDYTDSKKNQYAYMLEGFESDWNYVENRNFANYTGVPPGEYLFKVKGSNNDGYWNELGTNVKISILPPPWKTWWAYLAYFIIVSGIMLFILKYYLRRQKLLHEIRHLEEEKKILAAKSLIEGQEDERKRISIELHDGLGVLISAAKLHVSSINPMDSKSDVLLSKANNLLQQASVDVRKISHNMMPGLLTKFGIFEAIRDLVDNINELAELKASLSVSGTEGRLPENTEIMIYRIIQELINNTLKHAKAKSIVIAMKILPDHIDIRYEDDGVGFDKETTLAKKTIGLQSIQSRISFLDGSLNMKSDHGEGIVFLIKIPT